MDKVANLHEDIKAAPFYVDVESKTPPEGKREVDPSRTPPESMKFKLQLSYKPAEQWKKNEGLVPVKPKGKKKKRGGRR